jgi:hypothetical protein
VPRVGVTGHDRSNVEIAVRALEQNAGSAELAARFEEAKHSAFGDQASTSRLGGREPGEASIGETDHPALSASFDDHLLGCDAQTCEQQSVRGDGGRESGERHRAIVAPSDVIRPEP